MQQRGKLNDQQRTAATRGMAGQIAHMPGGGGGGEYNPALDERLVAKRQKYDQLQASSKDISNSAYHYTKKMRDEDFTGIFVPPTVLAETIQLLEENDGLRIRARMEKKELGKMLNALMLNNNSNTTDSLLEQESSVGMMESLPLTRREQHEKTVHQKRFALKNQRMKQQLALDELQALEDEHRDLAERALAGTLSSGGGGGGADTGTVPSGLVASSPAISGKAVGSAGPGIAADASRGSSATTTAPATAGADSKGDRFNEALLEAASRFFLESVHLSRAHRFRMLASVSELCGRPVTQPPLIKDLTVFEMIGNQLGDQLAALSSYIIRDSKTVINISLGNTGMTDSGCAQLALALRLPSDGIGRLRGIFLGANLIHGTYAVLLLQALLESTSVGQDQALLLDLSGNPLFRSANDVLLFTSTLKRLQNAKPNVTVDHPPVPTRGGAPAPL